MLHFSKVGYVKKSRKQKIPCPKKQPLRACRLQIEEDQSASVKIKWELGKAEQPALHIFENLTKQGLK